MNVNLRNGRPDDAEVLGNICFHAFKTISNKHNFPEDFPSPEVATGLITMLLSRPDIYSVVAEVDGRIAGSNFLWESDDVSGVGPITIDPDLQNSTIGRELMQDVIRRSDEQGFPSVRLVQAAYHNRSLALYTKLGFNTVEPLSLIQGEKLNVRVEGFDVRPMEENDVDAADIVAKAVHGISRKNEIAGSVRQGSGAVVENNGRITGYSTGVGFLGHTVGTSNNELKALIAAAAEFAGPGLLLPTRNSELMRWCLEQGLKIVQPMTLMSRGVYQEPRGAFMPSVLY
jgi:ribosomal protein S18 acetylase RimI-like enzyme